MSICLKMMPKNELLFYTYIFIFLWTTTLIIINSKVQQRLKLSVDNDKRKYLLNQRSIQLSKSEATWESAVPCSWTAPKPPSFPPSEKDEGEQKVIKWLNDWGIVYSLSFGSLLGAYRHQGKIPFDGDLDIIYPVFLNQVTDECEEVVRSRPKSFVTDVNTGTKASFPHASESDLRLCGQSRQEWVQQVEILFRERLMETRERVKVKTRSFGGFRVYFWYNTVSYIGVDVVVSIWDEFFWKDPTPTCRCAYRGQMAQCFESALDALVRGLNQTKEQLAKPDYLKYVKKKRRKKLI